MTTYQNAQQGSSRPGGILAPQEVAAMKWADFVIRRYGKGKDHIVESDAGKMLEESYQHLKQPKKVGNLREVQDYFNSLDVKGKRNGRLNRDDLKQFYLAKQLCPKQQYIV